MINSQIFAKFPFTNNYSCPTFHKALITVTLPRIRLSGDTNILRAIILLERLCGKRPSGRQFFVKYKFSTRRVHAVTFTTLIYDFSSLLFLLPYNYLNPIFNRKTNFLDFHIKKISRFPFVGKHFMTFPFPLSIYIMYK
jgi:acid stress-induced BolA-like protein IbaG/YrbA